jgi:phage-related holin
MPRSQHVTLDRVGNCLFFISNQPIEIVESLTHLGHRIMSLLDDDDDIINRRSDFMLF